MKIKAMGYILAGAFVISLVPVAIALAGETWTDATGGKWDVSTNANGDTVYTDSKGNYGSTSKESAKEAQDRHDKALAKREADDKAATEKAADKKAAAQAAAAVQQAQQGQPAPGPQGAVGQWQPFDPTGKIKPIDDGVIKWDNRRAQIFPNVIFAPGGGNNHPGAGDLEFADSKPGEVVGVDVPDLPALPVLDAAQVGQDITQNQNITIADIQNAVGTTSLATPQLTTVANISSEPITAAEIVSIVTAPVEVPRVETVVIDLPKHELVSVDTQQLTTPFCPVVVLAGPAPAGPLSKGFNPMQPSLANDQWGNKGLLYRKDVKE